MGNLDQRPTRGITGAIGPALVLRAIFAELNRDAETGPFPSCSGLQSVSICAVSGMLAGPDCPRMDEKFEPGKVPVEVCSLHSIRAVNSDVGPESVPASPRSSIISSSLTPATGLEIAGPGLAGSRHPASGIQLLQPTPGLQIAMDPRIPAELQAFAFRISKNIKPARVQWVLNGKPAGETGKDEHQFLWPLSRGEYIVRARVWRGGESEPVETPEVAFVVK